jgi:3',5'-cyclic AMP phosphodiesterase CpdA
MGIRIGLITDIHHGPDREDKPGSVALTLVDRFVDDMRERVRPDLIVDMGDRINDVSAAEDGRRLAEVVARFSSAPSPALHLHGNHDVVHLDLPAVSRILGRRAEFESVHVAGFHIVLLNSQDPTFAGGGGTLSPAQLEWLAGDLRHCAAPKLVFCHHPLDEQDVGTHWYFARHEETALARNREHARALFARDRTVRAVFSGHLHWTHASVLDGIPYLTLGSLVETTLTGGLPAGTTAEAEVGEAGEIQLEVRGRLPVSFRYP